MKDTIKLLSGNRKEELFEVLLGMDMSMKTFVRKNQDFDINIHRADGKIAGWVMSIEEEKSFTAIKRGKCIGDLIYTLNNEVDKNATCDTLDCKVLCYCDSVMPIRKKEGIVSTWYRINPDSEMLYQVSPQNPGLIQMDTMELCLSETEFKAMIQTKIAFYVHDTFFYPITQEAIPSVGKLLDASLAFRSIDGATLPGALFLAQKLSNIDSIQFMYRERTGRMRPLLCVASNKFIPRKFKMQDIIQYFYEKLLEYGICDMEKWAVSDESTVVEFLFIQKVAVPYQLGVKLTISDMAGVGNSVLFFAKMNTSEILIPICINSKRNSKNDTLEKFVEGLLENVNETLSYFQYQFSLLSSKPAELTEYSKDIIQQLISLMKKKELKVLHRPDEKQCSSMEEYFVKLMENILPGIPFVKQKKAGLLIAEFLDSVNDVQTAVPAESKEVI